jgi:hypothetical protein
MARLNDEGQWIVMMGFIVCVSLFFLSFIVNESTLVGQTTAESVLDFSKSDIQELKADMYHDPATFSNLSQDIKNLSFARKNTVVYIQKDLNFTYLHFNNGVTVYNETVRYY